MDHPGYKKPTYLSRKHYQGDAYHYDHVELGRPNIRHKVPVPDSGEGNNHVVGSLEQVQMTVTCPLEMLDTTYTASKTSRSYKFMVT
jgi:hypothetical protein